MSNTVNNYTETDLGNTHEENMMTQLRMNILIQFHIGAAHTSAWQSWRQRSPELLLMRDAIRNIGR